MRRASKILSLLLFLVFVISSLITTKPEKKSTQTATPTAILTPSSNPTSSPTPTQITTIEPTPTLAYPKPIVPEFTVKLISSLPEAVIAF